MGLKPWMQALVWLGLGGGVGFFAGYRLGVRNALIATEEEDIRPDIDESEREALCAKHRQEMEELRKQYEAALDAQREYLGGKDDEVIHVTCDSQEEDIDDAVMYEEVPGIDEEEEEEDIPQLHPEDLRPFGITRSEYTLNPNNYDQMELDYYTEDCVIFDPEREEKWTHPEQLLGLGWKAMFISGGDKPVREAYVQNDTMETLYKITRIDDSFERLYEEE